MRGIFIFGALLALVGWASWRLYPRQQRALYNKVKDYQSRHDVELREDAERTPG